MLSRNDEVVICLLSEHISVFRYIEQCVNLHNDAECNNWANSGECDVNPDWMIPNCRQACRKCGDEKGKV